MCSYTCTAIIVTNILKDGTYHLADTKRYIRDFRRLARTASDSTDLYQKMLKAHPDRLNSYILELSTIAYFANHTTKAT
jgi:hypothetical protein